MLLMRLFFHTIISRPPFSLYIFCFPQSSLDTVINIGVFSAIALENVPGSLWDWMIVRPAWNVTFMQEDLHSGAMLICLLCYLWSAFHIQNRGETSGVTLWTHLWLGPVG